MQKLLCTGPNCQHLNRVNITGMIYWVWRCSTSKVGKVIELMETGANDVLVVTGQQRHLIPFVMGIHVLDVDLDEGVIRVDWEPEIIK